MKFYLLIVLLLSTIAHAQTIAVLDVKTNKPVPFAAVLFTNGNDTVYGSYVNEKGVIAIPQLQYDKVAVSCIGYEDKKSPVNELDGKIYLRPKAIDLKEVVIEKSITKPKEVSYGNFDERTKFMWFCFPKTEFIVLIKPDEKLTNCSVKKVLIPVTSDKKFEELETDKYIFRLTVYDVKKEPILSEILQVSKEQILNDDVSYTPENEMPFPDEGLYFGIELLGWDTAGEFLDNSYYVKARHSLSLRFSKVKDYDTFYHTPFKGDGEWQLIKENVEAFQLTFDKPIGLSLGLILNKYK